MAVDVANVASMASMDGLRHVSRVLDEVRTHRQTPAIQTDAELVALRLWPDGHEPAEPSRILCLL